MLVACNLIVMDRAEKEVQLGVALNVDHILRVEPVTGQASERAYVTMTDGTVHTLALNVAQFYRLARYERLTSQD